jgi:hypothetical protein
MPEIGGANIEVAHHVSESHGLGAPLPSSMHEVVEILEAIILALVACATGWSGYQAARWDSQQSLHNEASELFERGTAARERADDYVRVTVTLATVLLLTAISQRFRTHWLRIALIVVGSVLLCFPLWRILTLPRA